MGVLVHGLFNNAISDAEVSVQTSILEHYVITRCGPYPACYNFASSDLTCHLYYTHSFLWSVS